MPKRRPSALLSLAAAASLLTSTSAASALSSGFGNAFFQDETTTTATSFSSSYDPALYDDATLELWFKPSSVDGEQVLLSDVVTGNATRKLLYLKGNVVASDLGTSTLAGKTAIAANTWHHVAVVHEKVGRRTYLYLDGELEAVGSSFLVKNVSDAQGKKSRYLGATPAGVSFRGSLDEVRVWSRPRGALEIKRDMSLALKGDEFGLKDHLSFDDSGSNRASDDNTAATTYTWDTTTTGYLLGSAPGATPTFALVSQGTKGTASVDATTGKFTYTRASSSSYGDDTFTYSVSWNGASQTRTMTVRNGLQELKFTRLSGTDNPLFPQYEYTFPVDLDLDGDVDYFKAADECGGGTFMRNTGTARSASFVADASVQLHQYTPANDFGLSCPAYVDLDRNSTQGKSWSYLSLVFSDTNNDGLWDVHYYRNLATSSIIDGQGALHKNVDRWMVGTNTGTLANPVFLDQNIKINNQMEGTAIFPTPADYAAGAFFWFTFQWWQSFRVGSEIGIESKTTSDPLYSLWGKTIETYAGTDETILNMGAYAADLDGDGDSDLINGGMILGSYLYVYRNTASPNPSTWTASTWKQLSLAEAQLAFTAPTGASFSAALPVLADLDGDGDLDVIVNGDTPGYYRNDTKFRTVLTPPVVSGVTVYAAGSSASGVVPIETTLTGGYAYADADGDSEVSAASTYLWQRADSASGASTTNLQSGWKTYSAGAADVGKYIRFCVTPGDGTSVGAQACSAWSLVQPSVKWHSNTSYGGDLLVSPYGLTTCVNMPASFNDVASSVEVPNAATGARVLRYFADGNCSGGTGYLFVPGGGSASLSSLVPAGFNDAISSFRVASLDERNVDMNGSCYTRGSTLAQNELNRLIFTSDGVLRLQRGYAPYSAWSDVWTAASGGDRACIQQDGNFVVYNSSGKPIWASGTNSSTAGGRYHLKMQTDCNLVIYSETGAARWATGTRCQ